MIYRIRDWSKQFENNRTRELKKLDWVPIPNKHDGDGFTDLIGRPDGPALFGAWVLILQLASKCEPRGVLCRQNPAPGCDEVRLPHTAASISRITRCPEGIVQHALDVCVEIGWIEAIDEKTGELVNPAAGCGIVRNATPPTSQEGALEGKGMEGKGKEQKVAFLLPAIMTSWQMDETYAPFVEAWRKVAQVTGKPLIDEDFADAHFRWKGLDFEQKLLAIKTTHEHLDLGAWTSSTDPQFVPLPAKYLEKEYKRPVVARKPREAAVPLTATQIAIRRAREMEGRQ